MAHFVHYNKTRLFSLVFIITLLCVSFASIATVSAQINEGVGIGSGTSDSQGNVDGVDCTLRASLSGEEIVNLKGGDANTAVNVNKKSGNTIAKTPIDNSGSLSSGDVLTNEPELCSYAGVKAIGRWVGVAAGIVGVMLLIIAGMLWMRAGEDTERAKKAKALAITAILGFLIAALSGVIFRLLAELLTG